MSEKPLDLIEKYLERVRVYLPIDSEDVLIEIRTHLLEEAETIGDGNITRGSVMMAIERFGEPKDAANAAAGTGQKVGPVPEKSIFSFGPLNDVKTANIKAKKITKILSDGH